MATAPSHVPRIIRRTQFRTSSTTPPMPVPSVRADAPAAPRDVTVRIADQAPRLAPEPAPRAAAERVNILDHPVAMHALTVLRNRDTNHQRFQITSRQLLVVLVLEAMRSLPTNTSDLNGTRGPWTGYTLAKPTVLLSVNREGLSLSQIALDCIPGLLAGSVSLERSDETALPQARLHLSSAPALSANRVILFEPVVQSGESAGVALNFVRQMGATDISLVSFVITAQGLLHLQSGCSDLNVWTAHVDSDWDAKRNPRSVLGDFGARLFA